jgi:uncharacterized NAD(P)/FAD-binding protein YdhS
MPGPDPVDVAIIGGGAAGTFTAVHLLRAGRPVRLAIVERADRLGRGIAYSTTNPRHLMNVPASTMGGLAGRPGHLVEWCAAQGEPVEGTAFVDRPLFGRYLVALLRDAVAAAPSRPLALRADAVAVGPAGGRLRVALASGRGLDAARVVLATGTPPAADLPLAYGSWPRDPSRYLTDPWAPGALEGLAGDHILLLGTGLTTVDVALRLAELRPSARLVAVSRTGLLPVPHRWPEGAIDVGYLPPPAGTTLREQARAFRGAVAAARARGADMRDVVDAMRPHTQAIWQGLSDADRRRFMRRYARYWLIHRSRMAPAAAGWFEELRDEGRLRIVAAAVAGVCDEDGSPVVGLRPRGGGPAETLRVDAIVNCAGPADSSFTAGSPLYRSLLDAGLARPHPLGLGIDTGPGGAVLDAGGRPSEGLYTVGWLRRGELWESLAIPELRDQAAALAERFSGEPARSGGQGRARRRGRVPPSLWQAQHRWAGFPPLTGPRAADVAVVGAGVTGCACALRLAAGGADVVLLDGEAVAAGASGRNGGFASAGTGLGLGDAAAQIGLPAALELVRATGAALDAMLALAAERGDPGAIERTGSLWIAAPDEAGDLRTAVARLRAAGFDCREAPELVPAPMRARYTAAAVFPLDCRLEPARFVRALAGAAAAAGARVHERSPVEAIEPGPGGWRVRTAMGDVTARAVVVACDGRTPRIVPELEGIVYPVRGQMLATEPLSDTVIALPTHSDHGFVYARPTRDGRLAIGGCRSADLEAEYTVDQRPTAPVQAALERFMGERMGLAGVRVDHRWAGTMGFSADLLPVAGEVPGRPGLHVACGYSGVGNVQGFVCGGLLADGLLGRPRRLAAALSPNRFAVDGRLRPAPELREQAASRRLRPLLPA